MTENPSTLRSSLRLAALRREVEKSPTTKNSELPATRLFESTLLSTSLEISSEEDGTPANASSEMTDEEKKHAALKKWRAYMKAYREKGNLGKGKEEEKNW